MADCLVVDSREPESIRTALTQAGVAFEVRTLLLGDFLFSSGLVVERKEVNDFFSSVMDGRLFSQAGDLSLNYSKVVFLVQGSPGRAFHVKNQYPVFFGALARLVVSFNVQVVQVRDEFEAVLLLKALLVKGADSSFGMDTILYRKESDVYVGMLCQVPGVGVLRASRILACLSFKDVLVASVEDLSAIEGVGLKTAREIKKWLHS